QQTPFGVLALREETLNDTGLRLGPYPLVLVGDDSPLQRGEKALPLALLGTIPRCAHVPRCAVTAAGGLSALRRLPVRFVVTRKEWHVGSAKPGRFSPLRRTVTPLGHSEWTENKRIARRSPRLSPRPPFVPLSVRT